VTTGSSDYHGSGKNDHDLGCNTTDPAELERLLAAAEESSARSGRTTPRVTSGRATGTGGAGPSAPGGPR
jgi:3',5'-nucleoside bisphosphate phosphatase